MSDKTETQVVAEIGADYKYGFHDDRGLLLQVGPRALARDRRGDLRAQERAGVDAQVPAASRSTTSRRARCRRWGGDMSGIDFDNIFYYIRPTEKQATSWEDLPPDIKNTWDRLGIPEAERKFLAGVGAQYESEVVYHKLQEDLEKQGVIFLDMDSGPARARGARQAVLRHDHPAERQQVRRAELGGLVGRLVHLRAAGRARSRCRSRPTSASTRRTWASSSAR